jgi:hypothetical protein
MRFENSVRYTFTVLFLCHLYFANSFYPFQSQCVYSLTKPFHTLTGPDVPSEK